MICFNFLDKHILYALIEVTHILISLYLNFRTNTSMGALGKTAFINIVILRYYITNPLLNIIPFIYFFLVGKMALIIESRP